MGFTYGASDAPIMCFNAPKGWQLGWYTNGQETVTTSWSGKLYGIADYSNIAHTDRVILQMLSDTEEWYVSFNRKSGINSQTQEGGDQVLVHRRAIGTGLVQSFLVRKMNAGDQYTGAPLDITVDYINLSASPPFASVKIGIKLTPSPTQAPTSQQTSDPTNAPTDSSTAQLTASPTNAPTDSPTAPPTRQPTHVPTNVPTHTSEPTNSPTDPPIIQPTFSPLNDPSSFPISQPTKAPSEDSSRRPTALPTNSPTEAPTPEPSSAPTMIPTSQPTPNPTEPPSRLPTDSPTDAPTEALTEKLSLEPSNAPTENSRLRPTTDPTEAPSTQATSLPTKSPTRAPRSLPTFNPTDAPSTRLTASPIDPLTKAPTETQPSAPSKIPTVQPTLSPTNGVPKDVFPRVQGEQYNFQSGTHLVDDDTAVGYFDNGDYLTYKNLNFGPSGTTKSIRFRYSKGLNTGGKVELRIGGPNGILIGEFFPVITGDWFEYKTKLVAIDDVDGIQDLTLVAKGAFGVMNLNWFKLTDIEKSSPAPTTAPTPYPLFSRIQAEKYDIESGTKLVDHGQTVGYFDNGDYLTYKNVNFGPSGTTKRIQFRYAKAYGRGTVELRIGGPNGILIGEFSPNRTGGWFIYRQKVVRIEQDVDGIQDLTLVGNGRFGIVNINWFKLLD